MDAQSSTLSKRPKTFPKSCPESKAEVLHPVPSSTCTNFQLAHCITPPQHLPVGVSKPPATSSPFTLHTHPRWKQDPKSLLNTQRARSSLLKDPGSAHWKINWSSASEGLVYKGNSRDGGMETIQWQSSLTPHNSELIFSPQQGAGDGNRSLFTHGGPLKGPCSRTLGAAGES